MGLGGSVMQWNPELKIGFGFVPVTQNMLDFYCYRGSKMQKIVMDIVQGTYKPETMPKSCTCNIF